MGQELPHDQADPRAQPDAPTGHRAARRRTPTGPGPGELAETAELVYGMALLAEGGDLSDPARFTRLLADRLARTL